jgi:hypothetical protein
MVVDGGFNYQAHSKIRKLNQEVRCILLMSFNLKNGNWNNFAVIIFFPLVRKFEMDHF